LVQKYFSNFLYYLDQTIFGLTFFENRTTIFFSANLDSAEKKKKEEEHTCSILK